MKELQSLAKSLTLLDKQSKVKGPQTDEELHAWIKKNLGLDIPRVAVCDDHVAPFSFIADLYFERETSAIAMANRGGSKTMSSAILHFMNSLFKPSCESLSVGAIEAQAERCYDNLKKLIIHHGGSSVFEPKDHPDIIRSIESQTTFKNGSKTEIVPGTISAVSGPHPQKVALDEQDQMDPSVYQQAVHMSQSKKIINPDGTETIIKAQDWITSTRQRPSGPMQKLFDEIDEAKKMGVKPPFKPYVWCVYETTENVPNCQVANPDLPKEKVCKCHDVVKGKWEDGTPRRFTDVCKGKLAKSQGFLDLDNTYKRFLGSDQDEWEAQQECSKPELGGMVFKTWSKGRYGIKWWSPDPGLGPIFESIDFGGGTTPAAVNWYQVLARDLEWWGIDQTRTDSPNRMLKAGTRVCFDEIYKAEIGNNQLGEMIKTKEYNWKAIYPAFKIEKRFADPANKTNRIDFAGMGLSTHFYCTRDIKEQVRTCNTVLKDDLFAYDTTRCEMLPLEMEAYHYPEKKVSVEYDPELPIDDFNHCVSNFRYFMENLKWMERRGSIIGNLPRAGGRIHQTAKSPIKSSAPRYMPREERTRGF